MLISFVYVEIIGEIDSQYTFNEELHLDLPTTIREHTYKNVVTLLNRELQFI